MFAEGRAAGYADLAKISMQDIPPGELRGTSRGHPSLEDVPCPSCPPYGIAPEVSGVSAYETERVN